jgi:hypothetical protein
MDCRLIQIVFPEAACRWSSFRFSTGCRVTRVTLCTIIHSHVLQAPLPVMSSAFRSDRPTPTDPIDTAALAVELLTILMREAICSSHRHHVDFENDEDDDDDNGFANLTELTQRRRVAAAPPDPPSAAAPAPSDFDPTLLASYRAVRDIAFCPDQAAMVHRLRDVVPDSLISVRHHRTQPSSSPRLTRAVSHIIASRFQCGLRLRLLRRRAADARSQLHNSRGTPDFVVSRIFRPAQPKA